MAFVFATQKYTYDVRYIGVVPLVQCTSDTVAAEAVELLNHKLDSIQVRVAVMVSLSLIACLVCAIFSLNATVFAATCRRQSR